MKKKCTRIEIENSGYILAGFDHFESKILAELNRVKYRVLEDIVCRLELTYDKTLDILDDNYKAGSTIGFTLPLGVYASVDIV